MDDLNKGGMIRFFLYWREWFLTSRQGNLTIGVMHLVSIL